MEGDLLVTCLNEELDIGRHEGYGHCDIASIG
jgi:hypothetical protein